MSNDRQFSWLFLQENRVAGFQRAQCSVNVVCERSCSVHSPMSTKQLTASNLNRIVWADQWFWHFERPVACTRLDETAIVITPCWGLSWFYTNQRHVTYVTLIVMFIPSYFYLLHTVLFLSAIHLLCFLQVLILADGNTEGFLYQKLPVLSSLIQQEGKATAYVCRDFTCALPVTCPQELRRLLLE